MTSESEPNASDPAPQKRSIFDRPDDVRALHPDDAAVAEVRAWIPEGTPDEALIELEAHTLRGVLAVLDGWRRNAFAVAAQRNAVEAQLAETSADGAQWQARAEEAEALKRAAYADRSAAIERADAAERELAELRALLGEPETEWRAVDDGAQ